MPTTELTDQQLLDQFITIMDAAESNPAVRAKIIQRLK